MVRPQARLAKVSETVSCPAAPQAHPCVFVESVPRVQVPGSVCEVPKSEVPHSAELVAMPQVLCPERTVEAPEAPHALFHETVESVPRVQAPGTIHEVPKFTAPYYEKFVEVAQARVVAAPEVPQVHPHDVVEPGPRVQVPGLICKGPISEVPYREELVEVPQLLCLERIEVPLLPHLVSHETLEPVPRVQVPGLICEAPEFVVPCREELVEVPQVLCPELIVEVLEVPQVPFHETVEPMPRVHSQVSQVPQVAFMVCTVKAPGVEAQGIQEVALPPLDTGAGRPGYPGASPGNLHAALCT